MVSRTEPNDLELVGDRSQLIYSNPTFDPAERAYQRGEMFSNNKEDSHEVLKMLDTRSHNHRPFTADMTFAHALIDESNLDLARQDATQQRHALYN